MSDTTITNEPTYPLLTYLSLPTKLTCPNPKCAKDLYYYSLGRIYENKPVILTCASCSQEFPTPPPAELTPTEPVSRPSTTQSYYETLGVERTATQDEITRAYKEKILQCHPDRIRCLQKEWERFTKAYTILSDKRGREVYDIQLAKSMSSTKTAKDASAPVKIDWEQFIREILGEDKYYALIRLSSVSGFIEEMKHSRSKEPQSENTLAPKFGDDTQSEENRAERVRMIAENLAYKLDLYALDETLEGRMDRWSAQCKLDADEIKKVLFGAKILKVSSYFNDNLTVGPGSWGNALNVRFASWGSRYNTFASFLSTIRKGYSTVSASKALQTAESNPQTTPEQRQALEENAAKVGIETLWSFVLLEVDNIVKEACDVVLDINTITNTHCLDRITALERLGMEFESAELDVAAENFLSVKDEKTGM